MKRMVFISGLAVGYLLGARAGRARYEAIMRGLRAVADRPEVQGTAGLLQAQAGHVARSALEHIRHGHPTEASWN